MARVIKFSVTDDGGAPAPGQTIASASFQVTTGANGLAQALLGDDDTAITLNDMLVYRGDIEALNPTERFTTSGKRLT